MTTLLKKQLIANLSVLVLAWLATSFMELELNPIEWEDNVRSSFVGAMIFLCIMTLVIVGCTHEDQQFNKDNESKTH